MVDVSFEWAEVAEGTQSVCIATAEKDGKSQIVRVTVDCPPEDLRLSLYEHVRLEVEDFATKNAKSWWLKRYG